MDRTAKIFLFVIAVGIWVNVAWRPTSPQPGAGPMVSLADYLQLIDEQRKQGKTEAEVQTVLLAHVAAHTRQTH